MKKLKIALAVLAVVSFAAGLLLHREQAGDERALLREMLPAASFGEKAGAPPCYRSIGGEVAFNSHDIVPSIRGYAGPIRVLLVLGNDGRIKGIRLIEHRETKNYVHYMETPDYLNRFMGKSVADRFEVDRDVDGITRATVSVEALARTVRDSSRIVASGVYGITVSGGGAAAGDRGWFWYLLLFAAALAGYAATRRSETLHRLRDICMLASIVVVGFLLSSPFSVLQVFNLALFGPSSSTLWYAIMLTTSVSLAFAGRFYCGWICPFGAIAELIGRLPARKWAVSREADDRYRKGKYYLFGAILALVLVTRRPEYANVETYVTFFSFHGTSLAWMLVAGALLLNLRVKRFWCRFLCPVAALTGLVVRGAKDYPSRSDCPMANQTDPPQSECIRCNRCYVTSERVKSALKLSAKEG